MLYVLDFIVFYIPNRNGITTKNRKWLIKSFCGFYLFLELENVRIGCNGKQIGVFGLHCRQDLFAIPGEKIINPMD